VEEAGIQYRRGSGVIERTAEGVKIVINCGECLQSMALLKDLRDYCKEQTSEGTTDTEKALTVAIETMVAFCCEHFDEYAKDEDSTKVLADALEIFAGEEKQKNDK
jgi:hypothetical protein